MRPDSLLFAFAIVTAAAGLRQVGMASRQNTSSPGDRKALPKARWRVGERERGRLERAGLAAKLGPARLVILRAVGAGTGASLALLLGPLLPGRLLLLAVPALIGGGLLAPDLMVERAARQRHRQIVRALPDAVEVLAVGADGGRSLRAGIADLGRAGSGPLARELAMTAAEVECGVPAAIALSAMRRRVPGPELAALTTAIERSARLGSPLVAHLHRQAAGLREDRRRRLAESSAKAAPKIQLVIALILVPSVLLMIAAGLAANIDLLTRGF